jgi:hypothetical protein
MTKQSLARGRLISKRQRDRGLIHREIWGVHQDAYSRLAVVIEKADDDYYGLHWVRILAEFLIASGPKEGVQSRKFGPRPVEFDETEWRMAVDLIRLVSNGEFQKAAQIIESLRSENQDMWIAIRHCVCTCMRRVLAGIHETLSGVARREVLVDLPLKERHPFFCGLRDRLGQS